MNNPYNIIKIDKYTKKIQQPTLLLMNRSFDIIGKINSYENWNICIVANGIDEITFEVHKYINGKLCPIWDNLIDLKIVDVSDFGRFEISVDYTDNTETVKVINGQSLEVELAQIGLYEFHVNDDEATDMVSNDNLTGNYDNEGNFIPTVFYNPDDKKHSLLHRVISDKAPHWSIGEVTPYIALSEEEQRENVETFQRTYTVNGDSIYDFLTGTVAKESNVVFIFDTIHRRINCYSLSDCKDLKTGDVYKGIGEDTFVFVSKNKLANEITISSNKDNIKNCFRIDGGDDVITDMVRAVNMNGSNYIYQFADFQYNDMSEALRTKIKAYQDMMSSKDTQDLYYGENGIYTRLCNAYDDLSYYESSMMPNTDKVTDVGKAKEQYDKMVVGLNNSVVAVSSMNNYNNNLFVGITNNIEAYAQILIDSRFDLEIVDGTTSYSYVKDSPTGIWTGKIRIKQHTDETNVYPVDVSAIAPITVTVNADELAFAKQKIEKALSKGSMLDIDFDVAEMSETDMREYFNQYSLNRLKSFYDGYNSCISVLSTLGQTTTSDVNNDLYNDYFERMIMVEEVLKIRQNQVDEINTRIINIQEEQRKFQEDHDFKKELGDDLYKAFCAYRREDTYTNSNYISDGLSTSECLAKAKKLVEVATKEAKKACVLQRIVSTSLNNLFALSEFEPFYEKFALFNYIRVRTEDEILKLRLIGIEFSGDSAEEIQVTFSEQIESVDGTMNDLQSVIQQAGNIATSFPSTALQAKQGSEAKDAVLDMYTYGLNTAKTMLANNDSNEVTITSSGIICRRMDDEGFYGDKQIRTTGNIIAFTDNAWKSVKMAIGETTFKNPITGEDKHEYGIIAENLVGKFIAGESAYIGNEKGSVLITGDRIKIDKGIIMWGSNNVNAPEMNDINGLTEFKNKVNTALTGSTTTEIGSDYIISPKIGGGYLYISDQRTDDNTGTSVEINPNGTSFEGHNDSYVFNITKDNNVIMGVDNSGDGYFQGKIYATGGEFTGDIKTGSTIMCGDNFTVDEDGRVIAKDIKITGGDVKIEQEIEWMSEDERILTDKYELSLTYTGIFYKLLSDETSYSTELKADGLSFNGIKIIDNPGQTFPSIINVSDVTTLDGISLRKIKDSVQALDLKIDRELPSRLSKSKIKKIGWVDYKDEGETQALSYLALNINDNLTVLIRPDKYLAGEVLPEVTDNDNGAVG